MEPGYYREGFYRDGPEPDPDTANDERWLENKRREDSGLCPKGDDCPNCGEQSIQNLTPSRVGNTIYCASCGNNYRA